MNIPQTRHDQTPEPDDEAVMLNFGDMEKHAGFVLRIAQLTAFERFFEILQTQAVKISEYSVLVGIALNPGVRQGVLADCLKIKWSNMTKLVRGLEEQDLIGRRIPPNDRRSVELYVTDKGHEMMAKMAAGMHEADRQAVAMLSEQEHAQLLMLLRKVAGWPPAGAAREAAK